MRWTGVYCVPWVQIPPYPPTLLETLSMKIENILLLNSVASSSGLILLVASREYANNSLLLYSVIVVVSLFLTIFGYLFGKSFGYKSAVDDYRKVEDHRNSQPSDGPIDESSLWAERKRLNRNGANV